MENFKSIRNFALATTIVILLVGVRLLNAEVSVCSLANLSIDEINERNFSFSISLKKKMPNCLTNNEVKLQPLNISLDEEGNSAINDDGIIILEDHTSYYPEEYCLAGWFDNEIQILVCQNQTREVGCGEGCIRKCCKMNETLSYGAEHGNLKCVHTNDTWKPHLYNDGEDKGSSFEIVDMPLQFVASHPREEWCEFGPFILDSLEFEGAQYLIRIFKDGSVKVKSDQLPWRVLEPGTFCVDEILRNGVIDAEHSLMVLDCSPPDEEAEDEVNQPLYIVFQAVACCFLILTVLVYLILHEKQNIHSWTTLGYAISMLCLHISIFVIYFHNSQVEVDETDNEDWACICIAVIAHFFYLATFCWLTLINFDVWVTFGLRLMVIAGGSKRLRFFCYMMFAFITPSAILLVGLLLNSLHKDNLESSIVYLEYSRLHCSISDSSAFFFKFLPVALLLSLNLVLFIMTIVTLYRIGQSTKFATTKSSRTDAEKSKFVLFVKLFFVMGVIWILELVSYFTFGRASINPIAYVLDIIVIMQPVAIFVIFVCKSDILRGLQLKLPVLRRIFFGNESSQQNGIQRKKRLFLLFGLKQIPSRFSSGLSSVSNLTQVSTCSTRSQTGNQVSFEMTGGTRNPM